MAAVWMPREAADAACAKGRCRTAPDEKKCGGAIAVARGAWRIASTVVESSSRGGSICTPRLVRRGRKVEDE